MEELPATQSRLTVQHGGERYSCGIVRNASVVETLLSHNTVRSMGWDNSHNLQREGTEIHLCTVQYSSGS